MSAVSEDTVKGTRLNFKNNRRWLLPPVIFLGLTIAFIDRANLGVAAPQIRDDLGIGAAVMGIALGAFPLALAVFQLATGWLIDRVGPRLLYTVAIVWWSLFTAATAFVRGTASLLTFRFMLGVGEAPSYQCSIKAVSEWFPKRERATATSVFDAGTEFGGAFAIPLVTALVAIVGWRGSFIATGLLGLVWGAFWFWFYRSPREHPKITRKELSYIEEGGARNADYQHPEEKPNAISWVHLLRYRTIWGLIIGMACRTFTTFFFLTWYPTYLIKQQGFSLLELGLLGGIPGIVAIVSDVAGGVFTDYLMRRGVRPSVAKKGPLVGGMLLGSVIGFAPFTSSPLTAMVLLTISYAGFAFLTGALWSLPADVAPSAGYVASIGALMNSGANIMRFASASLVGVVLAVSGGSFVGPLLTASGLAILGALSFLLLIGKAEPLPPISGIRTATS